MVSNRKIGEKGKWFGREVEHTVHFNLITVFFSRFLALEQNAFESHIFVEYSNPRFMEGCSNVESNAQLLYMLIESWLIQGKAVTVQVTPGQIAIPFFTKMRKKYMGKFLLLVSIDIPEVDAGGYALKAVPVHPFGEYANESGVVTMYPAGNSVAGGYTPWSAYENDIDGEM